MSQLQTQFPPQFPIAARGNTNFVSNLNNAFSLIDIIQREEARANGGRPSLQAVYVSGAQLNSASVSSITTTTPRRFQAAVNAAYDEQRSENITFTKDGSTPDLLAADYGNTVSPNRGLNLKRPGAEGDGQSLVYGLLVEIDSSTQVLPGFTLSVVGFSPTGSPITNDIAVNAAFVVGASGARRVRVVLLPALPAPGGFAYTPWVLRPASASDPTVPQIASRVITADISTLPAGVSVTYTLLTRGTPVIDALVREHVARILTAARRSGAPSSARPTAI